MPKKRNPRKNKTMTVGLSREETWLGWGYFVIFLVALPALLNVIFSGQSALTINVWYYGINFVAIIGIFHRFLLDSLVPVGKQPFQFLLVVALGLLSLLLANLAVSMALSLMDPAFTNVNDQAIGAMRQQNSMLMLLCTALLVPPVEECLFRGLIFQGLYRINRVGAYCLSILAFSAVHILNYLDRYTGQTLLLCFLQYVPAGLVLAWSYEQADSIFAPMFIHAAVNVVGMLAMR